LNGTQREIFQKNIYVTSGVPKGSHLGPLLFTRIIIELHSIVTHSRVSMYADEVKLCYHIII